MPFVVVGLALGPSFQQRQGPVTDEVVEARQDGGHLGLVVLGGGAVAHAQRQDGFEDAGQEKGLEQVGVRQVGEQVRVVVAVSGQHEGRQLQRGAGLADVPESRGAAGPELVQARAQGVEQGLPRGGRPVPGQEGVSLVQLLLPAGVGPAVGKVQVAQQRRQRHVRFEIRVGFHHLRSPLTPSCLLALFHHEAYRTRPIPASRPCQPGPHTFPP